MPTVSCACNSGKLFNACCGPLLSGTVVASTAEALMRSRYVAYTLGNADYLLRTWHPSTRPAALHDLALTQWQGLQVIRTKAGSATDKKGIVEFQAHYIVHRTSKVMHETSRFIKENGQWFYVEAMPDATPTKPNRTRRNAPCPCGSGKKYKRCCGR